MKKVTPQLAAARKALEPCQHELRALDAEIVQLEREAAARRKEAQEASARVSALTRRQLGGENVTAEITKAAIAVQISRQVVESAEEQARELHAKRRTAALRMVPLAAEQNRLELEAEKLQLDADLEDANRERAECEGLLDLAKRKVRMAMLNLEIFAAARHKEAAELAHEAVNNDYNLRHGAPGQRPNIIPEPQPRPLATGL